MLDLPILWLGSRFLAGENLLGNSLLSLIILDSWCPLLTMEFFHPLLLPESWLDSIPKYLIILKITLKTKSLKQTKYLFFQSMMNMIYNPFVKAKFFKSDNIIEQLI